MTRRIITAILNFVLRIFFRRIEISGVERVPTEGAVIFVLNHPNGLIDPVFILCLAPRPVSLLGKSTLFKMPIIGWIVREIETMPIYRKQDSGEDTSRNRETFQKCRELLERGGSLALFPEGVSHSEPSLRPLKTGAARIALGAASAGMTQELRIVPVGLYYTAKATFRSSALLYFGDPIKVNPVTLDENYEPPREAARALSDQLEIALREVTLNADQKQAMDTVARAKEIFMADVTNDSTLNDELQLKKRFVEGYEFYRTHAPEKLAHIEGRIRQHALELQQAGLDSHDLAVAQKVTPGTVASRAFGFALWFPFALAGAVIHYPAYKLSGILAKQFSHNEDDIVSTIKVLSSALLFPLTWIICAVVAALKFGWVAALIILLILPSLGFIAVRFQEEFDTAMGVLKAMLFFVRRHYFLQRLIVERRQIRAEIMALGEAKERSLESL